MYVWLMVRSDCHSARLNFGHKVLDVTDNFISRYSMGFFRHSVMGCIKSKDPADDEAPQRNTKINKLLKTEKKKMNRTVKVLLLGAYIVRDLYEALLIPDLGAGESGKSTIIKQMRIIYEGGFSEDERRQTRAVIYSNVIAAFKVLLDIMDAGNIDIETKRAKVILIRLYIFLF